MVYFKVGVLFLSFICFSVCWVVFKVGVLVVVLYRMFIILGNEILVV